MAQKLKPSKLIRNNDLNNLCLSKKNYSIIKIGRNNRFDGNHCPLLSASTLLKQFKIA